MAWARDESPVEVRGLSVERDRLVGFVVIGSALNLDRQVVPLAAFRIARYAGGNPLARLELSHTGGDAALVAEDEPHIAKELANVELECFW